MGATAILAPAALAVDPGNEVAAELTVRNTGQVVDQFNLQILGDPAEWGQPEPASLSLFPGSEGTARIVFRPPRSHEIRPGPTPFGVRVESHEDPAGSVVEEGVLDVGVFLQTAAELTPRTSHGSLGSTHELAIDNRGNAPLQTAVTADDADKLLAFDLRPPSLDVAPGTASFVRMRVKPRSTFWLGPPKMRPFKVLVSGAGDAPIGLDATMLQVAILPSWFLRACMALIGLLLLLLVLWLSVLRPAVESEIKTAVNQGLVNNGLQPLPAPGSSPAPSVLAAPTPTPSGGATAPPTSGPTPSAGSSGGGSTPVGSARMSIDGRLSASGELTYKVPKGQTLNITDIVFANPDSESGTISLDRDGTALMVLRLQNFRSLDFHFVTPMVFTEDQLMTLNVSGCDPDCAGAQLYYTGYQAPGAA